MSLKLMTKYIFVTGGVVSSLGKGIVAASLGHLLSARGYKVSIQKLDPYLNVDPGTMSPYQHGEVFVTADGAETDLDLGHYERFIDTNLTKSNSVTSGQIYTEVLAKERRGDYLGATVQMVPHVTNLIKEKIVDAAKATKSDILIVEVGGTVGDIESSIFIEAIRQFRNEMSYEDTCSIHVTLVPHLKAADELKTKPTQHSVELLRSKGIQPDLIVLRADRHVPKGLREKLSLFTNVPARNVIESKDCKSIYEVPAVMQKEGLASRVLERVKLDNHVPDLKPWEETVKKLVKPEKRKLKIGIVGKYVSLSDAYISVTESIKHACAQLNHGLDLQLILSDDLDNYERAGEFLSDLDAIVIPGGFGDRGIEGKLNAIRYARENKIPLLGLCLGLQCTVIEAARNLLNLKDANSIEFDAETQNPVIHLMEDQKTVKDMGATMRLGDYPCKLVANTKAQELYKAAIDPEHMIIERHRHRYEVNNSYREDLAKCGLVISGTSPDENLVEIVEYKNHPYLIACQFHPEFLSRPTKAHPLFLGLINAAIQAPSMLIS